MARKKKSRRKRHHECNGSMCFHGAFIKRGDAEAKARKVKGAFVLRKFGRWGRGPMHTRHVVATKDASVVPF